MLAFPLIYKRPAARNTAAETAAPNPSTSLVRYGFNLTESSKASGIEFNETGTAAIWKM